MTAAPSSPPEAVTLPSRPPVRVRWCVSLSVLLGGLVACGDGTSGSVDRGAIAQEIRSYAAQAVVAGRTEQAALLEDGMVTDSEFRQAVVSAVECMERAGLAVSEIERIETLEGYDLTFVASPNGQSAEVVSRISDECETRFDLTVRAARSVQYAGILKAEARSLLQACLQEAGIDAAKASRLDEFIAAASDRPNVASRCIAEATATIRQTGVS